MQGSWVPMERKTKLYSNNHDFKLRSAQRQGILTLRSRITILIAAAFSRNAKVFWLTPTWPQPQFKTTQTINRPRTEKKNCQYIQGETLGQSLKQPSHIWMIQGRPTSLRPGELLVAYRGPPQLTTTQAKTHKDEKKRVT